MAGLALLYHANCSWPLGSRSIALTLITNGVDASNATLLGLLAPSFPAAKTMVLPLRNASSNALYTAGSPFNHAFGECERATLAQLLLTTGDVMEATSEFI